VLIRKGQLMPKVGLGSERRDVTRHLQLRRSPVGQDRRDFAAATLVQAYKREIGMRSRFMQVEPIEDGNRLLQIVPAVDKACDRSSTSTSHFCPLSAAPESEPS
jgi:hypothetical protein